MTTYEGGWPSILGWYNSQFTTLKSTPRISLSFFGTERLPRRLNHLGLASLNNAASLGDRRIGMPGGG